MKLNKQPPKMFTVHGDNDHQWSHFHINVFQPKPWSEHDYHTILTFRWQSNADKRWEWYGLRTEASYSDGNPCKLIRAGLTLVTGIYSKGGEGDCNPQSFLTALAAMGYKRGAYDGRVSRYVAMENAIDPLLQHWLDDLSHDRCNVGGLFLSHEDAQR